jgi:hypothetical protein
MLDSRVKVTFGELYGASYLVVRAQMTGLNSS